MTEFRQGKYIPSLQPYWQADILDSIQDEARILTASLIDWRTPEVHSIPGNGQVGLAVTQPEDIRGRVYGVMKEAGATDFSGLEHSVLLRFAPGTFSRLVHIPVEEIDPVGIDMEDVFTPAQLAAIRDAAAAKDPVQALFFLFGHWMELEQSAELFSERCLVDRMSRLIWARQGNLQIKDLEAESGYSSRYLQSVFLEKIGITPKQMCRQVRFQAALRTLEKADGRTLAQIAASLGYSDQAHLSREFREFACMTPGEFRKKNEDALRAPGKPIKPSK